MCGCRHEARRREVHLLSGLGSKVSVGTWEAADSEFGSLNRVLDVLSPPLPFSVFSLSPLPFVFAYRSPLRSP